jgi:hypothetical protein
MNEGVLANFGRERYVDYLRYYEEQADDNGVACRLAAHFATLSITGELVNEALELPWTFQDPLDSLLPELVGEAAEADRAAAALRHVVSWAHGHASEFFGRTAHSDRPPAAGWAGRWARGVGDGDAPQPIGFLPHRLKDILTEAEYDAEAILRTWRDRRWLATSSDGPGRIRH